MNTTFEIHTYEFEWFDGDDWTSCQFYSSYRDDVRIMSEFKTQQYEDETIENLTMEYIGEGNSHCGTDIETGMTLRLF